MSILDRLLGRQEGTGRGTLDPSSPFLEVAKMQTRHIRHIMPIEQGIYPRPWTARIFEEEIALMKHNNRRYLVAHVGGELVGYAGLLFSNEDAHVTNIAVSPEWQGRGVATELLLELAWFAREHKFKALTLEVRHTNTVAQKLYQRFGFVPAGVRKKYYENTDDAIVMWCSDIQNEEFERRLQAIESTRK